jgi:hypothetical protein
VSAAVFVSLITLLVFSPSLQGDFLNWDDDRFVVNNPAVQSLSWQNVVKAFSELSFESYQPLHLISYMLDAELWPGAAVGYKAHNLLLYLEAILLLLFLMKKLGLAPISAALGVLFFCLAPYRVESVAWISARKDVLMLLFGLGAWHLHLAAHERPRFQWALRGLAFALFLAALLSKSSALVLPLMILIVDIWILNRPIKKSLTNLAMFIPLSLAVAAALPLLWSHSELVREPMTTGMTGRLSLVGWTLGHYFDTVAWPFRLSPLYGQPDSHMLASGAMLGFGVLGSYFALLWFFHARQSSVRIPLALGVMFLSGLAPFLNIVPMYYLVADRYLLLPSIALGLGAAYLCDALINGLHQRKDKATVLRGPVTSLFLAVILAQSMGTYLENRAWRSSSTLWSHAVSNAPGAFYAWLKLGETLRNTERFEESSQAYQNALRLKPLSPTALGGLFWSELLTDTQSRPGLSRQDAENLAYRFVSMANDAESLLKLAQYLEHHGYEKARAVVVRRLHSGT